MGWDAELHRKLAVPLAVSRVKDRAIKTRILKESQDLEDIRILATLAENRLRLERLAQDLENDQGYFEPGNSANDLDYIKASIQLSLLEITGELEQIPSSDEVFEQAIV